MIGSYTAAANRITMEKKNPGITSRVFVHDYTCSSADCFLRRRLPE